MEVDRKYVLRPDVNVWCTPDVAKSPLAASNEEWLGRIARIVRQAHDFGCGSAELCAGIVDWPTQFHLSPERLNGVRPLEHLLRGRVLEVGAECGAITRFLGESGARVVALENHWHKAVIAAARCRGLENVTVVCDGFSSFEVPEPFDCITLIGAMEQSPSWMGGPDPAYAILERCSGMLAPGGVLAIALDNQLGLKYFAGAPEEHTGRVFYGVSGLYSEREPRTIGRGELETRLQRAGFKWYEFLYPFPDYKLARLILHPSAFRDRDFPLDEITRSYGAAHDNAAGFARLFSERLAWQPLIRNGLAEQLANSFIVVASREKPSRPRLDPQILAYNYSVLRRRPYQKSNQVVRAAGGLLVRRSRLWDLTTPEGGPCKQEIRDEGFLPGQIYATGLYELLDRQGWTFDAIMEWFRPYYQFLLAHCDDSNAARKLLPPNFVDATPFNIMRGSGGRLTAFDLEWVAPGPVLLQLVLFRGLLYTLNSTVTVAPPGEELGMGILELAVRIIRTAGEPLTAEDIEELFTLEDQQQKWIVGDYAGLSRHYWQSVQLAVRPGSVLDEMGRRHADLMRLSCEITNALAAMERQVPTHRPIQTQSNVARAIQRSGAEPRVSVAGRDEEIRRLGVQNSTLTQMLADRDGHILRLLGLITAHNTEITRLTALVAESQSAVAERSSLSERLALRDMEAGHLRGTVEQLNALVADRDAAADRLRAERDLAQEDLRASTECVTALKGRVAEQEERLAALSAEASRAKDALREGTEQLTAATRELSGQHEQIDRLSAALAETRDRLASFEQENEKLRGTTAAQHERIESLSAELSHREERIRRLMGEARSLRSAVMARERQISGLQDAVAARESAAKQVNAELAALRNSYAWALAAPLRLVESAAWLLAHRLAGFLIMARYAISILPGSRINLHKAALRIAAGGCFDPAFYLRRYPVVARMGVNPLMHYLVRGARQRLNPNPLFDTNYYLEHHPEVSAAGRNPLLDYLERGARERISPHPLFDTSYYLEKNPDVAAAACNPLVHYLAKGALERRDPSPLFDTGYYLNHAPDVSREGANALCHYLEFGADEGRDPHPLFDTSYYLKRYPEIAERRVNPLAHYVEWGAREGRSPHPLFDTAYYLAHTPEARALGANPLVDYAKRGAAAGCAPHPLFDVRHYIEQAGEEAATNPLGHYLDIGIARGYDPHPLFDTSYYLQQAPEAGIDGANPLSHYIERGAAAGYNPHPLFNTSFYLERNPDVAASRINPLIHYIERGAAEGRDPHPLFKTSFYVERNPRAASGGQNPLVHYVRSGFREGVDPHPLFHTSYYLSCNPGVGGSGCNPLVHYIQVGAAARKDPNPLFDTCFYLERNPDVERGGLNPLIHYVNCGVHRGADPHPLFSTSYYLAHNPDIREAGCNPLAHFIVSGGGEGRDPHPLFHCEFYLNRYPEVAVAGINPLIDYVQNGVRAGRNPNPMFDTSFYLERNQDVVGSGVNALVHYIQCGAAEGRNPNPTFDTSFYLQQYPEVAEKNINPLQHYFGKTELPQAPVSATLAHPAVAPRREGDTISVRDLGGGRKGDGTFKPAKTIVCVTHVPIYPPRAGNEYRIYRMLRYFQECGYRVVLVLAPLGGDGITDAQFLATAEHFPNLLLCNRGNELVYHLQEGTTVVAGMQGVKVQPYAQVLGETTITDPHQLEQLRLDRSFCPDFVIGVVTRLQAALGPCVLLAEYIFMSRLLPLVEQSTLKIVDTHDVFSAKQKKVMEFGISESLCMTPEDERRRLLRADIALAIQRIEQRELAELVPERRVLKVGVDFDVVATSRPPVGRKILLVASDNPMNVKGLRDFLRLAWPLVSRDVPDAELLVAGRVSNAVRTADKRVQLLGVVERVDEYYQEAKVVINPSVAGTGLKIKTVEALCHFRPAVTWPSGIDGIEPEIARACATADDWYQFSRSVIAALLDDREEAISDEQKLMIRKWASPDSAYGEFRRELEKFFVTVSRKTGDFAKITHA